MAKLDRLLNLVAALTQASVPLTAEEIRRRVPGYSDSDEAYHRAFERDKDELREMGIPIETVMVTHHDQPKSAYTIRPERYELADPGLDATELAALHLAATSVQLVGLDESELTAGLRKLGGAPAAGEPTGLPLGAVPTPEVLPDLFAAVLERRVVQFEHNGRSRRVEPHQLQFERGRWYLAGHDLDRDAPRVFRLDRVDGAVTSSEPDQFEPAPSAERLRLRPWEMGSGDTTPTTLLVDGDVAGSIVAADPSLVVLETRDDGSIVFELAVRNVAALVSFALSLLDRAEVLAPETMRDAVVDALRGQLETEPVSDR